VEDNSEQMIMVFASDSAIQILLRAETISVDGTFQTCPPPFAQLFILIATLPQGSTVPVVYGLLPNKTAKTYTKFFRIVEGLAEGMFKGKLILIINF
jgi:hypothetical protein